MIQTSRFLLPESIDLQELIFKTDENYTLEKTNEQVTRLNYLDSFDWRLYSKGLLFLHNGEDLTLCDLDEQPRITLASAVPRFVWDLPEGDLRDELKKPLAMRALRDVMTLTHEKQTYKVMNEDQKTVLRFETVAYVNLTENGSRCLARTISLRPLRGYLKAPHRVQAMLEEGGATLWSAEDTGQLFRNAGIRPMSYSSKLNLKLKADQRSDEALHQILARMMVVIRTNIEGIREDVDTEFLHDFRVAVRRIRSALSQLKEVLEPADLERARQDFTELGKMTNRMRDLDVYLLKRDEYTAMLPEDCQAGIEHFFEYLEAERVQEQKTLCARLEDSGFLDLLEYWDGFLKKPLPKKPTAARAKTPVLALASQTIAKTYRKVSREGVVITPSTPDQALHDLRIRCKKLRYLLEFFTSLYPKDKIKELVTHLKVLQDKLGDFNDFHVQQETLKHIAETMPLKPKETRETVLAIGVLVGMLRERQMELKLSCIESVGMFIGPDTAPLFQDLFRRDVGGGK